MKVAITCDYIIAKNHYSEMIETICELFPEAQIYTFVHREGGVLGRIEQRRIVSTHLSKEVSTEVEFYKNSSKLPLLAKHLFVSCEYDLIINISRGLSHGFKKCEKSKQLTYLYDLGFEGKVKKSLMQKLTYSWFLNFFVNSFKQADWIWVSREDLKNDFEKYIGTSTVVAPPFKINDYSLFPNDMFAHHFYLIETTGLSLENVRELILFFKKTNRSFQFIGPDEYLDTLKNDSQLELKSNAFFGTRCSGEHAPVMAASKMFISFNEIDFPKMAMGTLATGRPVLIPQSQHCWLNGVGVYHIEKFDLGVLELILNQSEKEIESLEGQKLRAHINPYHEIKFKSHLKRFIEKEFNTKL